MRIPFSKCEEAFLLKNVQNVIDVWARGSGLAKMNLSVKNGQAELQLFYQLGHPEVSHLPQHHQPVHPSNLQHPPNFQPVRRQKSQRRILKDRKRAAEYQSRKKAEADLLAAAATSAPSTISQAVTSSASTITSQSMGTTYRQAVISSTTSPICSRPMVTLPTSRSSHHNQAVSSQSHVIMDQATPATPFPYFQPTTSAVTSTVTPITQQCTSSPASCTTSSALSTPIMSIPSLYGGHPPSPRFTLETMPPPQDPDCPACYQNFGFPCYATPCLACGLYFHSQCYNDHYCSISDSASDDDNYASDTDYEHADNVAFPAALR